MVSNFKPNSLRSHFVTSNYSENENELHKFKHLQNGTSTNSKQNSRDQGTKSDD